MKQHSQRWAEGTQEVQLMKNAKAVMVRLLFGAVVISGFAACNTQPEITTLDLGDSIVAENGSSVRVPGALTDGDAVVLQPGETIDSNGGFPLEFPKACNTTANIVKNPKFTLGVVGISNMPPAQIADWQQAAGSPQSSGASAMGHGNPVYAQMWGFKDGGEAIRQVAVPFAPNSAYEVYISAMQFNQVTNPVALRFRLTASTGVTNPWTFNTPGQFIDDAVAPVYQTTWKKFGAYTITTGATAPNTITIASSNTTPLQQAQPKTVSWGRYDNVCIMRKEVQGKSSISIKKFLKDAPLTVGATEQYGLVVSNGGPNPSSTPLTVTDVLPVGLTPGTFPLTQGNWTCNAVGQTITCVSNTPLASGGSEQILIPVVVTAQQGVIKNCANVAVANDTTSNDNEACVANDVVPEGKPVNLAIRKQLLSPTTLPAGGTATYGLGIFSLGGSVNAGPVTVTDPMPAGLALMMPYPMSANWDCSSSLPTVLNCNYIGSFAIPVGFSDNISFNVKISKKLVGKVENCAKVSVAGDVDYSNNVGCTVNGVTSSISDTLGTALEETLTQLETYLETSDTPEIALERSTKGLKETVKTQVSLPAGTALTPVDGLDNLFEVSNSTTGEVFRISIECEVSYPPLKIRCTIFLSTASDKTLAVITDVNAQLVKILEASSSLEEAIQKATTGLKDTLKTQVRLAPGTTLTPLPEGDDSFEVTEEASGLKSSISITCDITNPPLKAICRSKTSEAEGTLRK